MQLCHFHLPSTGEDYVSKFRDALGESGVELLSLLIDDGDITDPEHAARDTDWIAGWLEVAQRLGAKRARVIAGKQPYSLEAMDRAAANMTRLASATDMRVDTENWFSLTSTPEHTNELLDRLEGRLGLCVDFGNWGRSMKYEALPQIMRRAETIHAKCDFSHSLEVDTEDFNRCLEVATSSGFDGPYVLVNGGPADEWEALKVSADFLPGSSKS
jgi:hypothetical protein